MSSLSVSVTLSSVQYVKSLPTWFHIPGGSSNSTRLPQPLFKRVVVMLVDALREDFVFGDSGRLFMPYTRWLVEKGSSHSFVAKARAPTVTMPRIKVRWKALYPKSIMSTHPIKGNNPSFSSEEHFFICCCSKFNKDLNRRSFNPE